MFMMLALACSQPVVEQVELAAPEPKEEISELLGYKIKVVLTGGATADQELPLAVAIHGLGSNPSQFASICEGFQGQARCVLPLAKTPYGNGGSWFPYRRNDPDLEHAGLAVAESAAGVAELITALQEHFPTSGDPVVLGFSQGGMLSFAIAAQNPELIGAAFPIGGYLYPGILPEGLVGSLPEIRAFHGELDDVVPLAPTQENIAELVSIGFDATLKSYPGLKHSTSTELRRDLYQELALELERQSSQ